MADTQDGSTPTSGNAGSTTAAPTKLAAESDNVVRELVEYVRSNTIRNEQQFILATLAYATGYMADPNHYVSGVLIGTSSSGKSHVKRKIEHLFPDSHLYEMSSGTEKAAIYDDEWDKRYIVCMQELQQPPEKFIEFLKSAHGGDEVFEYKTTEGSPREGFETETIEKESKPYFFTYAQFSPDFEMWNRLLKIPVHESESKNRAVGAMAFDHQHIRIDDDVEYGFGYLEGTRELKAHIRSIPDNAPGRVLLPNGSEGFEWDVWEIVKPIFNHERSEANRIYSMVANEIRSSAQLNYHNRDRRTIETDDGDVAEAIVAEPQDVVNVIRCREALLATTHEIDRKKRAICNAIDEKGGRNREVEGIKPITAYLSESDAPMVKKGEMTNLIEDLEENYLIKIHEDAGERDDIYEFLGWDELGFARVDEHAELFADCVDPITGDPFLDVHEELVEELNTNAQDILKSADDEADHPSVSGSSDAHTPDDGSGSLSVWGGGVDDAPDIELDAVEETVYEYIKPILDGERVERLDDLPVEALIGLVPLDDPDRPIDDRSGTLLDPDRDVWTQPDKPDDWVTTEEQARREVKQAITRLTAKDVIQFAEIHSFNNSNEPIDATISVQPV